MKEHFVIQYCMGSGWMAILKSSNFFIAGPFCAGSLRRCCDKVKSFLALHEVNWPIVVDRRSYHFYNNYRKYLASQDAE